jgi:hypothetical protein
MMECQTCDELLAVYRDAVSLYNNADRELLGGNFGLALQELKRLKQACRDADDALMEHLRKEHNNLSHMAACL